DDEHGDVGAVRLDARARDPTGPEEAPEAHAGTSWRARSRDGSATVAVLVGATCRERVTEMTIPTTMRTRAWRMPTCSAAKPSSGGAASDAIEENAETTATLPAALSGSSETA